jgi:hypothetical protein
MRLGLETRLSMETGVKRLAWAALVASLLAAACGSDDTADGSTAVTTLAETTSTASAATTGPPATEPASVAAPPSTTTATIPDEAIQRDNRQPTSPMAIQPATELPIDVRLGVGLYPAYPDIPGFDSLLAEFVESGVHRIDLSYSDIEYPVNWDHSETEIDPKFDRFIDDLNDQDIAIDYMIHFWDKEGRAAGEELATPRFQTEDQIQDFLDYISFMVDRYRGRIDYYTIWSEPDACGGGGVKCIEPSDYVALAKRVIPVIRELDPQAKVALAPVVLFHARDYMATLVESDVIAMFDVIQWHGIYNVTPGDNEVGRYYDDYPAIIAAIKDTAAANGFAGEYWSTEITWCDSSFDLGCPPADPPLSDVQVAKYYARSIVLHLGMDIGTSYKTYRDTSGPVTFATFGRLHTLLAGTTPLDIDVEIETEATNVAAAAFATSSGDKMLALWIDQTASDDDHRTAASLTFAGMAGMTATGIDVVGGVQQQLAVTDHGSDLVVSDLLISDAPFLVRLAG